MNIRPGYLVLSLCFLIFVGINSGRSILLAQSPSPQNQNQNQNQNQPGDVVIDGRVVLQIRASVKSITPEMRARDIEKRIVRYANDPYFNPALTTTADTDISTDIVNGEHILMSVLDVDAQAMGRDREELATQYAQALRNAIEEYRRTHSRSNMIKRMMLALLATLMLIIGLFIIQRSCRKIVSNLPIWAYTKIVPERVKQYKLIDTNQLSSIIITGVKFLRLAVVLILLYFYLGLVFSFFPLTQSYANMLLNLAMGQIKTGWQGVRQQLPNLFVVFIILMVTRYILKLIWAFFHSVEIGSIEIKSIERDLALPTYKIVRIFVIAFAATVAYPYIPGSQSEAFKGISIFLGVLLSLGSTSFVSNVVAGLTMTYMRAFKIGDRVKIDDLMGDVIMTRFQVTQIKSVKNEIITIPNAKIINSNVINYSALARTQGLILHTKVGIGYNAPWRQVRAMLFNAVARTHGLLSEPPPFIHQKTLDNFCVVYEVNAYTDQPLKMGHIYSDLHKNILDEFNEYQVQIMTPNYERDPQNPLIVPKEQWYSAPADKEEKD